jgi:chemosensory pili system protein ChpA (sensor histidine kinase/response regulator)
VNVLPFILVIEDDPSVQRLLSMLLESQGYDVAVARDGLEGLVKAGFRHPSLVVLDIMMPNVDGARVLREMREDALLAEVPVLVVTGIADAHATFDELVGPENVFPKPFSPEALLARVAAIVESPS